MSNGLRGGLRLVLDTNVVVSGLLWGGHSRRLLELALDGAITLYSSPVLVDELSQTLHYAKLAKRIAALQTTALALVAYYGSIVTLAEPRQVLRVIADDADDDHVLACAVEACAHLISSGDQHLHSLGGNYQGVRIVTPAEAAVMLQALKP
ncbi:MAG TPA: putative toxin-antitoxin system toxin component, PIN family [Rhodoferax sp.]